MGSHRGHIGGGLLGVTAACWIGAVLAVAGKSFHWGSPYAIGLLVAGLLCLIGALIAFEVPSAVAHWSPLEWRGFPSSRSERVPALPPSESVATPSEASPLDRLRQLQQQIPTLQLAIDNAYGEQAILAVRQRIIDWCQDVGRELWALDEKQWAKFREISGAPGVSDRHVPDEMTEEAAERQFDHIDTLSLRNYLRGKADLLGYAIKALSSGSTSAREPTLKAPGDEREPGARLARTLQRQAKDAANASLDQAEAEEARRKAQRESRGDQQGGAD